MWEDQCWKSTSTRGIQLITLNHWFTCHWFGKIRLGRRMLCEENTIVMATGNTYWLFATQSSHSWRHCAMFHLCQREAVSSHISLCRNNCNPQSLSVSQCFHMFFGLLWMVLFTASLNVDRRLCATAPHSWRPGVTRRFLEALVDNPMTLSIITIGYHWDSEGHIWTHLEIWT